MQISDAVADYLAEIVLDHMRDDMYGELFANDRAWRLHGELRDVVKDLHMHEPLERT